MLFAWASATVPKFVVIMATTVVLLAMCSRTWVPTWSLLGQPQVAVMGAEGAVGVLYRKELAKAKEEGKLDEVRKELIEEYQARFAAPWQAAEANMITDVIEPGRTRSMLALALINTLHKRENRPAKKHGNIAL